MMGKLRPTGFEPVTFGAEGEAGHGSSVAVRRENPGNSDYIDTLRFCKRCKGEPMLADFPRGGPPARKSAEESASRAALVGVVPPLVGRGRAGAVGGTLLIHADRTWGI